MKKLFFAVVVGLAILSAIVIAYGIHTGPGP
jgi:hypothetical protein